MNSLITIQMRADQLSTAEQVMAFAGRLLAQRDKRVAELPEDARQRFSHCSGKLERRGCLMRRWRNLCLRREPGSAPGCEHCCCATQS
jgi:hypothetical protein